METAARTPLVSAAKDYVQRMLGLDATAMATLQGTADAAWLALAAKLVRRQRTPAPPRHRTSRAAG
jgi:hypothetical protein